MKPSHSRHRTGTSEDRLVFRTLRASKGFFQWHIAAAALLFAFLPAAEATTYYSQANGTTTTTLTNWNSNPLGGGSTPPNFTSGDTFIIQNGHTLMNTLDWRLAGGATLKVGSGAKLYFNATSARTLRIGGNLVNDGEIANPTTLGGLLATIIFTETGSFSGTGTITAANDRINLTVDPGATLTLEDNLIFLFNGPSATRIWTINGTLDCGTRFMRCGTYVDLVLGAGASIVSAHPNGLGGSLVGFKSPSLSNLNSAANFTFNGSVAQVTGWPLPATVRNLTFNNPSGVTLGSSVTVTGTLTTNGRINLTSTVPAPLVANALVAGGTTTLNLLSGNFTPGSRYPLITYTSSGGPDEFVLGSLPSGVNGTLTSSGSSIDLVISDSSLDPTPDAPPVPPVALVPTNGSLQLRFPPETGYSYKVNASPDLLDWNHVVSLRGEGTAIWQLPAPERAFAKRFYRLNKVVPQGLGNLAAWSAFQAAPAARFKIGLIGDSYTQNRYRYTRRLKQTLASNYGDLGAGFLGFASFSSSGLNGSIDDTQLNNTIEYSKWATKNGGGYGPDGGDVTSLTANSSLSIAVLKSVSAVKFYYANKPGTAGFRYRIQSGGWSTVPTDAALSLGLHTVNVQAYTAPYNIDIEALGVGVTLIGAEAIIPGNGILLHKLGASGGKASHFTANSLAVNSTHELDLDMAFIMFGTNEQSQNTTPNVYRDTIQYIIDNLRARNPSIDLVLMLPCYTKYEVETPGTYRLWQYGAVLRELAAANNTALIDFTEVFGPASELQNLIDGGLMSTDRVHPTTTGVGSGGYLMADTISTCILSVP